MRNLPIAHFNVFVHFLPRPIKVAAQSSPNTPLLFTPTKLRGLEIRNRIMASPMCQYHSDDGGPNDWHMMHLGRLAIGGCGIVFGEETAVEPDGRKTHSCAGIYNQSHIAAYRRLTDMIKQHGAGAGNPAWTFRSQGIMPWRD
jgi:2,4-dienoyl-CoA reductase-like NADH-dependent reductase (Old Yellow Enzyme family)